MSINVESVGRHLGARVEGVDLGRAMGENEFAVIRNALNQHSVLVFPGQDMDTDAHADFSGRFGGLIEHVLTENLLPGKPEIYVLTNITSQNKVKPRPYAGAYWHTDLSYEEKPAFGSVMHGINVPRVGGDTMFASMAAAYDGLSERMQSFLEGMTATHSFEHAYDTFTKKRPNYTPIGREHFDARPPVVHPVIHRHPESGRRCLYVNPGFTMRINELPSGESDAILAFLYAHATRPEYIYRHQWTEKDVVMWDNRATMHQAIADYGPEDARYMHRTTIAGAAPVAS